jgi:hypothetical protein
MVGVSAEGKDPPGHGPFRIEWPDGAREDLVGQSEFPEHIVNRPGVAFLEALGIAVIVIGFS